MDNPLVISMAFGILFELLKDPKALKRFKPALAKLYVFLLRLQDSDAELAHMVQERLNK